MTRFATVAGVSAFAAALVASAAFAVADDAIEVRADKGLSLDVGPKHTMSYFEPKPTGCGLTVVIAAKDGGVTGSDTPGTRFTVTVGKGESLQIDTSDSHSATFECAPEGDHLHARLFERPAHPKGKAS